jgi:hypothetical protein
MKQREPLQHAYALPAFKGDGRLCPSAAGNIADASSDRHTGTQSLSPPMSVLGIRYPWMNGGDLDTAKASTTLRLTDHERVKVCVDVADGLLFW